ncbi:MAG: hypothetical protein FWF94_04075 [Oscillospiraceae bacterium]|nr:hypothetical protein [Oscillospiraceae bacterium]
MGDKRVKQGKDPSTAIVKNHGKLGDALTGDEEISEIFNIELQASDENTELQASEETIQSGEIVQLPVMRAPRKIYVTLSIFMIFFSIIGVVFSVFFVKGVVTDIVERRALKDEFALFIYPVVINDPPAFDSVDNLRPVTIITSAIWKIILTGDKSNYDTDMGVIYIPYADVEIAARSIFGTGTLEHQTVSTHGIQFIYSDQNNNYEVPVNPTLFSNSPLITLVENIGETYTVTVDYIAPSPLRVAGIVQESEPIKTMIYTISRNSEKMTIDSIQAAAFEHWDMNNF